MGSVISTIKSKSNKGFTLVESLLASVIVAIVASAIMLPFNAAIQAKSYSAKMTRAKNCGDELIELVLALPFEDPDDSTCRHLGPDSGESTWRYYDNIDDWHGYSDNVTQTGQESLVRQVQVRYRTITGQILSSSSQVCEVIVTVLDSQGNQLQKLSRLVYAELEL